jgi:hypothetical protein
MTTLIEATNFVEGVLSVQRILSVSLDDILGITLTCKNCGMAMRFKPHKWNAVPLDCPHCQQSSFSNSPSAQVALKSLKNVLDALRESEKSSPFALSLDFGEPPR